MEDKLFTYIDNPNSEPYKLWFTANERKGDKSKPLGYSPCVVPSNSMWDNSTLPNCVGGAYGYEAYLHDNKNLKLGYSTGNHPINAKDWWTANDGWTKDQNVSLGAVMVWRNTDNSGSGHVAVVVKVYDDGSWDSLESSYGNQDRWWYKVHYNNVQHATTRRKNLTFLGFKHSPYYNFVESIEPTPEPTPVEPIVIKRNGLVIKASIEIK